MIKLNKNFKIMYLCEFSLKVLLFAILLKFEILKCDLMFKTVAINSNNIKKLINN